ncbi:tetratricopeptide repeat protein, partial [Acinetobacter baumannii]
QQYANAESLARRGLSFAQSQAMKKQLWLTILKAGQQRNNPKTVQEAQQALKAL